MIDRYRTNDRRLLIEALRVQPIVEGNEAVARALAEAAALTQHAPGEVLLSQEGSDNHLVFLLSGTVSILINDREVNRRKAGQHVGEMALIDTRARRSASIVALEHTVAASIQEQVFTAIADEHPSALTHS